MSSESRKQQRRRMKHDEYITSVSTATLATRSTKDFENSGIDLINPFISPR